MEFSKKKEKKIGRQSFFVNMAEKMKKSDTTIFTD